MSVFSEFAAHYDFALDPFQRRACASLEAGRGVLVAAPTGAGKTVVGEFAVHLALSEGGKCFYTTPIKALSNQKYADLCRRYGEARVGLLTGDNAINGDAPVVVMTTEVLRNMLYAASGALRGLRYVVMDEVHYLADRSRGAVWEEVIIHLPESVTIVSLSATVSNAEEFGEWLATVRGEGDIVVEERRPVPLFQHVMVGRRLFDLFASGATDGAVNPELVRRAREERIPGRSGDRRPRRGTRGYHSARGGVPSRVDVVERLDAEALLPAIMFVFSRAGCDAAVQQVVRAGVRLTSPAEQQQIRSIAEQRLSGIAPADLDALGYHEWLRALADGVSAHHAGMLPAFKECVEDLFGRGLVKMVFATETLALGINMPARSVVVDRLTKWNGDTHADITPGEYTQLTGRAGRRGIDVEGHGVVLWAPGLDPAAVAGLASTRTYPLRSSFRPSYNMAVNLMRQVGRERARELLESSFAQFQADRAVVGLAREARRAESGLEGYAESARCDRGDFMEYAALRRRLSDIETAAARRRRGDRQRAAEESLERLRVGDVIVVPAGRSAGPAVVLDPGQRSPRDGQRPLVLTLSRQARRLSLLDFPTPVQPVTSLRVPRSFNARNPQQRRELAVVLRDRVRDLPAVVSGRRSGAAGVEAAEEPEIADVRRAIRAHPCHGCPDREQHARWAERYHRLAREADGLRRRIERRTNSIAREFDRVCEVLGELGYLDGEQVTPVGAALARIYGELDLLAAECLRLGIWAGLETPALAAALSALVFESRRPDDASAPRVPGGAVRMALRETAHRWAELEALERDHGLSFLREPDAGFAWAAYRWAGGADLEDVLEDSDLAAGDLVRWVKQLLDLADQLAGATDDPALRSRLHDLSTSMRRGVVAY